MDYSIQKITGSSFKITTGATHDVDVEIKRIPPKSEVSSQTPTSVAPTVVNSIGTAVVPVTNVYTLTKGDYYIITLDMDSDNNDNVYIIDTTENSVDYRHLLIVRDYLNTMIRTKVNDGICCSPEEVCKCGSNCSTIYDFNIMALISLTYFGETDLDISFNYANFTVDNSSTTLLKTGYDYKCVSVGTTPWDWREGTITLIHNSSDTPVTTSTLVADSVYTCVHTGFPADGGDSVLTAYTSALETRLNYIADAISKIEKYNQTCNIDNNPCSC